MTDIRHKLAAIFQGEHAEHLQHIRSILALAEHLSPASGTHEIDEAFRRAHSLKGAARAVDLEAVEGLASGLETLFSRVSAGTLLLDRQATRVILRVLDASEECVTAYREDRVPPPPTGALREIDELLGLAQPLKEPVEIAPEIPLAAAAPKPAVQAAEMVRLPSENLDRLVRSSGQILTESRRQETITAELDSLHARIAELEADCARFRKISAAPYRRLATQTEYASAIRNMAFVEEKVRSLSALSKAAGILQRRSAWNTQRSAEQLQRDVWSARMSPADDLFEGFRKMVRDLAREERKEIDFQLSGAGVRADRMVLQSLKDPVMHLLRNAISHGIETPAERERKGKSPVGLLILRMDSQRGRLIVEVEDDGGGLDRDKVADVLSRDEPGDHSDKELEQVIFRPGFSTSDTINHLSGRGMGLSVVYETVQRLQGDVELRPKDGPGASFLMSVPLSVSTSHLVLLSCAGRTFGIPSHGIERLYRLPAARIKTVEGKPVVSLNGQPVPLFGLEHLLQVAATPPTVPGDPLPVMVLRSGTRRFAVWVDEFLAEKDALIKELSMPVPPSGNISGAALLREGSVFLVLNPAGLVANCIPSAASATPLTARAQEKAVTSCILVVDDSITSRSLEKSILEAHGYRVRTAVDGEEALETLRTEPADLIITDIQMPKLDGFGLVAALKADESLRRIPVIIVSSLERPEDRQRGLTLGADAYIVKRKFDQAELLAAVRQMI